MTLLESSIILTRATNTHSQLRYIVGLTQEPKYVKLLHDLETIYRFTDTENNRQKLKDFLKEHSEEIYQKSTESNENYGDFYTLKH